MENDMNIGRTYPAAFLHDTYKMLDEHYNGDREKTNKWLRTANPALEGMAPQRWIENPDKWGRLHKFVTNLLDGNLP